MQLHVLQPYLQREPTLMSKVEALTNVMRTCSSTPLLLFEHEKFVYLNKRHLTKSHVLVRNPILDL